MKREHLDIPVRAGSGFGRPPLPRSVHKTGLKTSGMMTRSMTLRRVYLKRYNRAALSDHSQEDYRYTLNLWEKHTSDPTISKITDLMMADFRAKLLESGLSYSTVDRTRRILEAIFRCIAPPELGNPNGSGELRRVPRMEPCPRTNTPRVVERALADDPGPLPADPKKYTFRQATAALYVPESPEISPRTVQKLRHQANRWERLTRNPGIEAIGRADFIAFRQACLDLGLSAATIEGTISDVLTVIGHCVDTGVLDRVPGPGKRVKRRPILRETPSLESFAKVYSAAESVTWPVTLRRSRNSGRIRHAVQWWQGLLCASYLTGLRSSDLLTMTWAEVKADRIVRRMRKTGFEIQIPAHPVLMTHLAALHRETDPQPDDPIFGHLKAHKQLRQQLGALCLSQGSSGLDFKRSAALPGNRGGMRGQALALSFSGIAFEAPTLSILIRSRSFGTPCRTSRSRRSWGKRHDSLSPRHRSTPWTCSAGSARTSWSSCSVNCWRGRCPHERSRKRF
jgi:integrase